MLLVLVTTLFPNSTKGATVSCALRAKNPYKSSVNAEVYYITENCTKQIFPNENVFFSYFKSWNSVYLVDDLTLRFIPSDPEKYVPFEETVEEDDLNIRIDSGSNSGSGSSSGSSGTERPTTLIVRDGSVIKSRERSEVYLVINNVKFHIENGDTLKELGIPGNWIEMVAQKTIDAIPTGTSLNMHPNSRVMSVAAPNFMLFKDRNGSTVYRVEPSSTDPKYQVLRKISNETALRKIGYRLDRIPSVSIAEIPDLALIGVNTKTTFRIGSDLGSNSTISYRGVFEEIIEERQAAKNNGAYLRNEKYERVSFEYPRKFKIIRGFSYGGAFRDEYSAVFMPPQDDTSALYLTVSPVPGKSSSYTIQEEEKLVSDTHLYPTGFEQSDSATTLKSSGNTYRNGVYGYTQVTTKEYSNGTTEKRITFIYKNNIFTGLIRQNTTRGTELEDLLYYVANTFKNT